MPAASFSLSLADPDATAAVAQQLGSVLGPGDTILLEGDVGAGTEAKAREIAGPSEEID